MVWNKLILSALLLFSVITLPAQTASMLRTYFDDADYDISQEDYSSALLKLLKIYHVDSMNANVNYEIGICYLNSVFDKQKAVHFLEKAVKNMTPNYEAGSFDEKRAPYDAYCFLGDAYTINYDLKKAIETYKKYSTYVSPKDKAQHSKIERKIMSCGYANILTHNPVKVEKKFLYNVNTPSSDFFPVLNKDQDQLYFTSEQLTGKPTGEKRIYKAVHSEGNWQTSISITDKISPDGNLSVVFLSHDGKTILLCDDDENGKSLYESVYENRKWSIPRKMSKKINCGNSQSDACLSSDKKTIYFSSNRKDGQGGYDIYKSTKNAGEWGDAENLGDVINTSYDDICPRFLDDNQTLFFCSMGHTSIGGFDVFYSRLNDQKNWEEAVNMGYPFNTTDDENYYWPVNDGFTGYISLNSEFGFGEKEIYQITVIPSGKELSSENIKKIDIPKDTTTSALVSDIRDKTKENKAKGDSSIAGVLNNTTDSVQDMTILIKVTKNPLESAYLKEIEGIRAYKGKDELIRYYFGRYTKYEDANNDFEKILKLGFYSAQLKNLKEDTLYFYASTEFKFGNDSSDLISEYPVNESVTENTVTPEKDQEKETALTKENKQQDIKDKEEKKKEVIIKEEKKQQETNKKETAITASNVSDNSQPRLMNEITEKLLNSVNDIWVVQIATLPKTGNISFFKNIPYTTEHDCKDGKFRYSTGVFESIDEARKSLTELKKNGYADAYIVNFNKAKVNFFSDDMASRIKTYNLSVQQEQAKAEETKLYSIQIVSSIKPIEADYFKGIPEVKQKQTKNGYFKYFYGKYTGYKAAKEELKNARNAGYNDAFITAFTEGEPVAGSTSSQEETNTKETDNTQEDIPADFLTIQVASSKKQSDLKYFKGLEVKETTGKNNFYIYTYGVFSSVAAAKKELKKVKELGFKDAYINKASRYE